MSIQIKLDTQSLRDMLANNPDFKLLITQSVMNNIKNDVMMAGVNDKLKLILDDLTKRSYNYQKSQYEIVWNNSAFETLVTNYINSKIDGLLTSAIEYKVNTTVNAYVNREIKSLVEVAIDQAIDDDFIQERVNVRVKAMLKKLVD